MVAQRWFWAATGLAVVGTAGSLYLSLGMGLKACPLCFYQRALVMAVLAVLLLGRLANRSSVGFASLLALPLAAGGLAIAGLHVWLVLRQVLECPKGLLGWGPAPHQSLALFAMLTLSCAAGSSLGRGESPRQRAPVIVAALALGVALAWGCVVSAPPRPPVPAKPYDPQSQPLDMCRPPFRAERT